MFDHFKHALSATKQRIVDAFTDPVRRIRVVVQIGLVLVPAWVITGSLLEAIGIVATYFAIYEYVLEPISKWLAKRGWPSLVGPYWERGPHTDLGEQYRRP